MYMGDLSKILASCYKGCIIFNVACNSFSYADDMCLVAPSVRGLQCLVDICADYAEQHDILYNTEKTQCMFIKSKRIRSCRFPVVLNGRNIAFVHEVKYLGVLLTDDWSDDADIERQRRATLCNANRLLREFSLCSDGVKLTLFRTFYCSMYCPQLWYNYKSTTMSRIRVAYNNSETIVWSKL